MQSVNISRLSSGGLKIIIDELSPATYTNKISYRSFIDGIMLYDESTREILRTPYTEDFFTVSGSTSFTTIEQVCSALDSLGLSTTVISDSVGNELYPSGYPQTMSVEITRPSNTTAYTAFDNVAANVAVKQKEIITFTGTTGTANVTGAGGLTKLATFVDSIQQTAINFESAHAAAYALVGITLTRALETIVLEAAVAGVSFTAPVVTNVTGDLSGTVEHNTANISLTPIEFTGMCIAANGGGTILGVKIETNITAFAGKTFRLFLYDSQQTTLLDDNVAYVNKYVDKNKLIGFVDVVMQALLAGSDSIIGQTYLTMPYNCYNYSVFAGLETIDAVTPTSGGKINITLHVLELN